MTSLVDTHCHINFHQYDEDREAVLTRAADAGVTRIIIPAIDVETSTQIVHMSAQYPNLYATVGVHPNDVANVDETTIAQLAELAQSSVAAVGEIGLDYYWNKFPRETQIAAFEAQLSLAAKLQLPVIIHNRDASEDTMAVLEQWVRDLPPALKARPGVLHSFSGTPQIAERALDIGFYLGFTGPITFKKAEETRAIAASTPLNRILVETDGPYLTPVPYRGKRNEPAYIPYIVERIASVKQLSEQAVAQATTENAEFLFRLRNE
ncbi:MAG: TatD family hydrolase [Anaerolineae bacterium]